MNKHNAQELVKTVIKEESDLVFLRQRVRLICSVLGFEHLDQTRIATSVSEIARNAFMYASGGIAEISLVEDDLRQELIISISDQGKGISNLSEILTGRYVSKTGMGLGITGTRKLMDQLEVQTSPESGTRVTIGKYLPAEGPRAGPDALKKIHSELMKAISSDPYREMQLQNQQLISAMEALSEKKRELAETNLVLTNERALHKRFIDSLTHDLRSPLTAAKMAAEIIGRSKTAGENEKHMAKRIVVSIGRTDLMIQDMLDVSALKAGEGMPSNLGSCDLNSLIDQTIEDYKIGHGDRIKKLNSNANCQGFWDERTLKRAVENLINNAIKYGSPSKTIELFISNPSPQQVAIHVRNWGNVIPPEEQKQLFEEFKRSDSAKEGSQKGWGIGLAMVKSVAEAHGGNAKLSSSEEHGTVFTIQIPLDSRPFQKPHLS